MRVEITEDISGKVGYVFVRFFLCVCKTLVNDLGNVLVCEYFRLCQIFHLFFN